MPGFIGLDELPIYYIASDIYIHPSSHDPHPLAVSEALYCGLPSIVSDRIGSIGVTDDIRDGITGWVFRDGDTTALSEICTRVIDDPALRKRAGEAAFSLRDMHAADACGSRFVDGALKALDRVR
jgi:glycosyltransferase involved in cell wall biosynthesis